MHFAYFVGLDFPKIGIFQFGKCAALVFLDVQVLNELLP
jgi:hypothetical protein